MAAALPEWVPRIRFKDPQEWLLYCAKELSWTPEPPMTSKHMTIEGGNRQRERSRVWCRSTAAPWLSSPRHPTKIYIHVYARWVTTMVWWSTLIHAFSCFAWSERLATPSKEGEKSSPKIVLFAGDFYLFYITTIKVGSFSFSFLFIPMSFLYQIISSLLVQI